MKPSLRRRLGNAESLELRYFNALHRRIRPVARQVLESTSFSCPQKHLVGYEKLKQAIQQGKDLTPYLSKDVMKPHKHDRLLNDWGIQHLHLGEDVDSSGFASQNDDVLFARFDDQTCYCIAVLPHGTRGDQALIDTLLASWPNILRRFELKGLLGTERSLSSQDRLKLRNAGIQPILHVDGTVFAPPGGGLATTGLSVTAVYDTDYYRTRIAHFERSVVARADQWSLHAWFEQGIAAQNPVHLRFGFDERRMVAFRLDQRVQLEELW